MTLSKATLKAELLKIMDAADPSFIGWPATSAQAITNFANAYHTYALQATDISGDSIVTTNLAGFKAAITSAIPPPTPGGTLANYATTMASAFTAYWTGGAFAVGILPPPQAPVPPNNGIWSVETTSLVTVVNSAILSNAILAQLNQQFDNVDDAADAVANVWHTATTTGVTVTIVGFDTTPPIAGPFPIVNVNFVL